VYLYVPGDKTIRPHCSPPQGKEKYYTASHEIVLKPGEQYTIFPDTVHWFQSGDNGAIVSEFSTRSRDEFDIFTDPEIQRKTKITAKV
jgi:D-lyxose ketol-isomerase